VLGGNFGVWGGLFSTFDCTIKGIRKKEDPYNASTSLDLCDLLHSVIKSNLERRLIVLAGFCTGGALAIRGGYKAARNSAIMCGIFLAVIEGVGIGFQRMMAGNTKLEVSFLGLFHGYVVN
jgi:mitochondrial import inner membrane translocase subunit TIM17